MKSAAITGTCFVAFLTIVHADGVYVCKAGEILFAQQLFLERSGAVLVRNARYHEWPGKCLQGLWSC